LSGLAPVRIEEGIVKTLWENRNLKSIKTSGRRLRRLAKAVDLCDPVEVQRYVLNQNWTNNYKDKMLEAYEKFTDCIGVAWDRKHLKREEFPIEVPTEQNIDLIISSCTGLINYSQDYTSKVALNIEEATALSLLLSGSQSIKREVVVL